MNQQGKDAMGRFSVDLTVGNYKDVMKAEEGSLPPKKVRQMQVRGVVDSGASRLVIPESLVASLGLTSAGKGKVRYADHRSVTRKRVKDVWVRIQGREGSYNAIVEPNRTDVLIGAIVLEDLDFLVDCGTQQLIPRDPDLIVSEIE
ncbi:MAG TPA: aspartyl protease family protein [Gemmataceae bacterium]|nr:aspartyl protease family protein [Gemmataceae bacterium]